MAVANDDKMDFKARLAASKASSEPINTEPSNASSHKDKNDFHSDYVRFFKKAQVRILKGDQPESTKQPTLMATNVSKTLGTHQQFNSLKSPNKEQIKKRQKAREQNQQLLTTLEIRKNIKDIKSRKQDKTLSPDENSTPPSIKP
jgi:hypothetical protein